MFMSWGSIYADSWWGNANEANNWGIVYPSTAGGSYLTADNTLILADTTQVRADATEL
tara:strand:+ start:420 stop:593 length:174 start_codon:yes stop_codon:yes gene_type:complete